MRRRDKLFLGLAWGALLAGLAWALATQFRWVQENRPLTPRQTEVPEAEPAPEGGTRVVGPVGDDTREALAKGLSPKPPPKPAEAAPTRKTVHPKH